MGSSKNTWAGRAWGGGRGRTPPPPPHPHLRVHKRAPREKRMTPAAPGRTEEKKRQTRRGNGTRRGTGVGHKYSREHGPNTGAPRLAAGSSCREFKGPRTVTQGWLRPAQGQHALCHNPHIQKVWTNLALVAAPIPPPADPHRGLQLGPGWVPRREAAWYPRHLRP